VRFSEFKPLNENAGPLKVPQTPADVTNIQRALASFKYDVSPTGEIDNRTKLAIAQAQKDIGLPPTGEPDFDIVDSINTAMTSVPGMIDYITTGLSNVGSTISDVGKSVVDAGSKAVSAITSPFKSGVTPATKSLKPVKSGYALESNPEFLAKVDEVAGRLQIEPKYLMAIMKKESGLDPSIQNKKALQLGKPAAVGLIQFMPKTAAQLGTSSEKLRKMSAVDQMDYVEKFYKPYVKPGMDAGDLYLITFLPWGAGKKASTVLGQRGGSELGSTGISKDSIYSMNPTFDTSGKGYFTVADVKQSIQPFV